jgi:glycine/D-amino acid oxidase-like deaminating enzyme
MEPTSFERHQPPVHVVRQALAGSVNQSFWLADVATRVTFPPLQSDAQADLVIVGGGFVGLWSALRAKERDPALRVVLLEAASVGNAASGRNGGFCEASITHGETNGQKRWPEEFEQLEALGLRNLDEFAATLERYGIDCDFERTGNLVVATEPHQLAWLEGDGVLDQAGVRAEVDSPLYLGGAWFRDDGALLHPGKLCAELARVVTTLGVRIHERSKASGIRRDGEGVEVRAGDCAVRARQAILATNAFPSLLKRYRRHTVPVYDYVLMTEPLSAAQMDAIGWRHRQGLSDMGNQFHYYRLTRDNRILFGGYDAIYHFGRRIAPALEDRAETFERLAGNFLALFPQLEGIRFSHRWAGVIDTSTRFCAFFGRAFGGRVVHAAGFTGLGVGASRFAADVMLDLLSGRETELTRLRMVREVPMPFPPEPLAFAAIRGTQRALASADRRQGRRGLLLRTLDALGLGFDS